MFIKEKRERTLKARGCAGRRPQRQYTNKEDASSLTVPFEVMMMSCGIDTKEGRYIVCTIAEHIAKYESTIYGEDASDQSPIHDQSRMQENTRRYCSAFPSHISKAGIIMQIQMVVSFLYTQVKNWT